MTTAAQMVSKMVSLLKKERAQASESALLPAIHPHYNTIPCES